MLQKMKNKKGFTLVEMIVVIAIIAILIALIAPNVVRLIRKATETANDANAKTMQSSTTVWGTDAYTAGRKFDPPSTTDKAGSYFIYVKKGAAVKTANTSLDTAGTLDAFFSYLSTDDTHALLIGNDSESAIPGKDLRSAWHYYFYITKLGTCGGVIITDGSDEIAGMTQGLPGELNIVSRGMKTADGGITWA